MKGSPWRWGCLGANLGSHRLLAITLQQRLASLSLVIICKEDKRTCVVYQVSVMVVVIIHFGLGTCLLRAVKCAVMQSEQHQGLQTGSAQH